jgi:glycosyltransferase involved in cell wall biosynthesis
VRILQVITDTDRRGAQVFATDLGEAMRRKGHEVHTVALAHGQQSPSLDVEVLGATRMGVRTLRSLRGRMAEVDVTIAHGSTTGPACAVAGLWSHRFIYRQISDSRFWASTWPRRLRVAAFVRAADRVVALSDEARETLVAHVWAPRDRIDVVPNGVPLGQFHPPTESERAASRAELGFAAGAFLVGYVGALVPEKGVEDVVQAVVANENLSLVVAGDGPNRSLLEASVSAEAKARVRFVGPVDDPMRVYAGVDAAVLASRGGDSMPASLIEAGFCMLPSISTPVGSIEEIVVSDVTGIIVSPSSVADLDAALEHLRTNPALRSRLGENAARRCRNRFEIGVVADLWLEVLASTVSRQR